MAADTDPGRPLVTILVTVHDGEPFLAEALGRAAAQTHRPIEVLVVDDGSTDRSAEVAEGLGPPVRVLRRPHRGISGARNAALEHYRGEFLIHLDADDRMHPECVSRSRAALADHPEADAVFHAVVEFVSPGVDPALFADRDVGRARPGRLPGQCLIRRAAVARVGPYDETLVRAEGVDWISRLLDLPAHTVTIDDVLTERRLHGDNHGRRHPAEVTDYVTMARKHIHRLRAAADRER